MIALESRSRPARIVQDPTARRSPQAGSRLRVVQPPDSWPAHPLTQKVRRSRSWAMIGTVKSERLHPRLPLSFSCPRFCVISLKTAYACENERDEAFEFCKFGAFGCFSLHHVVSCMSQLTISCCPSGRIEVQSTCFQFNYESFSSNFFRMKVKICT